MSSPIQSIALGDLVVTTPPVEPVGEVTAVLETSRGLRLVVQRAFAPGSYVVVAGADVAAVERIPETDTRWVAIGPRPGDLLAGGAFRRELGRLRPDPAPPVAAPGGEDEVARRQLAGDLDTDPLIGAGDAEVGLTVRHGVALLHGWVRTVGAKVQAASLARSTPGIWAARNRLSSDEEIRVRVRDAIRANPEVAAAVVGFDVDLGAVAVHFEPGTAPAVGAAATAAAGSAPGVRSVVARVAPA